MEFITSTYNEVIIAEGYLSIGAFICYSTGLLLFFYLVQRLSSISLKPVLQLLGGAILAQILGTIPFAIFYYLDITKGGDPGSNLLGPGMLIFLASLALFASLFWSTALFFWILYKKRRKSNSS